jgi:uncharacterized membrane protein YgaE (UPF0421/DUF939 family)
MAKSIRSKQMRKNRTELRNVNSLHETKRLERLSKKLAVENLKTAPIETKEMEVETMHEQQPALSNKLKLMNRNQLKKRLRSKSRSRQ